MILSFRSRETARIFAGETCRAIPVHIQQAARRKLRMLAAAVDLGDLRQPPGNRLEKLAGDREGQHSIRVNAQWRICFEWTDAGPALAELNKHYG